MDFVASYSGGKDSILSIKRMIDKGHRLVAIIISTIEGEELSWTHRIEKEYFNKVGELLKCEVIFTDTNVSNYEKAFEIAIEEAVKLGASACVFGDIDIENHLKWNKERCFNAGVECIHPLMFEARESIVDEFINSGLKASIIKVDKNVLPQDFVGRYLDDSLVKEFRDNFPDIDLCGENGEYHTRVDIDSIGEVFTKDIYIDNASTNFPKAPGVGSEMENCINNFSYSINRGTFMKAYELQSKIIDIRDKVKKFFKAGNEYECIFTHSATEAINLVLRGYLDNSDKLFIDKKIHNSVDRTVEKLRSKGVQVEVFDIVKSFKGVSSNEVISNRAILINLVDNVTGELSMDLDELRKVGDMCRESGTFFIVDAVQAVCECEIDIVSLKIDALIATSHIGFMGPEGVGILVISKEFAGKIKPLIYGGTGSKSNDVKMPETLPDKFEAGTMNIPGVIGLGKALDYIEYVGIKNIIDKKVRLGNRLRDGLKKIKGSNIFGNGSFCLLNIDGKDMSYLSFYLDNMYKIQTRVGLHCSRTSHITNNTYPEGGIRLSVGYFNSEYEIDSIIDKINTLNIDY